jgi:outer membrane protein
VLDARVAPPATEPTTQPAGPLTLDDALQSANQSYEELGLRGEDYVQAIIAKQRAVAGFLPSVYIVPSYAVANRSHVSPSSPAVTGGYATLGDHFLQQRQIPVTAGVNLFRGFGDQAALKFADATIEQRKQILLDAQASTLIDVAQVFYQVLRSEAQRDVLLNSIKVETARVKDEEQKLNNGLSTNLAVAQVKAQLDGTRAALAQSEGDAANARTLLTYLIGRSVEGQPLLDNADVPQSRPPVTEFVRQALADRPDLLAAEAQLKAAKAGVDIVVAEYYPSVNLNIEGFLYRDFYSDASKWNAILSANIPIFSAGVIKADVRLAWSRLRQAALNERELRRNAMRDVRTAYQNLLTAERRIAELQGEVAAASDALKQAQAALQNKLGIVLDVLTAQDQLLNAQLQLTSAKFDRTVFYLELIRTTGRVPANLPTRAVSATTRPTTEPALMRD